MGFKVTIFVMMAIVALVIGQVAQGGLHQSQGGGHVSQGGPHENQRIRRQVDQANQDSDDEADNLYNEPPNWTTCDITVEPRISCADCNTRLICKPVGGLLKPCYNPYRPHCNNGICSAVPSPDCV